MNRLLWFGSEAPFNPDWATIVWVALESSSTRFLSCATVSRCVSSSIRRMSPPSVPTSTSMRSVRTVTMSPDNVRRGVGNDVRRRRARRGRAGRWRCVRDRRQSVGRGRRRCSFADSRLRTVGLVPILPEHEQGDAEDHQQYETRGVHLQTVVRAPGRGPRDTRDGNGRCVGWRARFHGRGRGARALRGRSRNRWDENGKQQAATDSGQSDSRAPSRAGRQSSARLDEQRLQLRSRLVPHRNRGRGLHPNHPVPPR